MKRSTPRASTRPHSTAWVAQPSKTGGKSRQHRTWPIDYQSIIPVHISLLSRHYQRSGLYTGTGAVAAISQISLNAGTHSSLVAARVSSLIDRYIYLYTYIGVQQQRPCAAARTHSAFASPSARARAVMAELTEKSGKESSKESSNATQQQQQASPRDQQSSGKDGATTTGTTMSNGGGLQGGGKGSGDDADSLEEMPLDIGEHYLVRRSDDSWRECCWRAVCACLCVCVCVYVDGWAEEDVISAEANRRCYLGQGSQNVLSRPRLTEDAISAKTSWKMLCYWAKIARSLSLGRDSIFCEPQPR